MQFYAQGCGIKTEIGKGFGEKNRKEEADLLVMGSFWPICSSHEATESSPPPGIVVLLSTVKQHCGAPAIARSLQEMHASADAWERG
jgi:hypothetical protein